MGGVSILLAIFTVGLAGCKPPPTADVIIDNVTIVDVRNGTTMAAKAIVISDGLISEVIASERVQDYAADTIVDGRGDYLMPALADAHVHIQSRAELQNFVRYGVGLVVNMSGGPEHLAMRDEVASGALLGPELVTVGPTLDGAPPTNPLFVTVDRERADSVVEWIADKGYDAIKVYQQMDAETLRAVISAAGEKGLITVGHVSREAGIGEAINAGQRFVAHGEELAFESFDEASRVYDVTGVSVLAEMLLEAGVTVTPMLAYLENIPPQVSDLKAYLDADEMRLLPVGTLMSFDARQGWFANRDDPDGFIEQIESLVEFVSALAVSLQRRGVSLILGTDAGFGGAIPGYSVHQELEALVGAGLTELAALQTATLNVGEYLEQIDSTRKRWGEIRPGYAASMLLIGGNPIEDIAATRNIRGVMIDGYWIDKGDLAAIEDALIRRQQVLLPMARAFEEALVAGDPDAARAARESVPAEMAGEPLISADNCIFLGYRHYYGGRRPLAGRLYEICAEMHPDSAPLWIHVARARESEKRTDAAVRAYARAHELNPWYGDPRSAIDRLTADAPVNMN